MKMVKVTFFLLTKHLSDVRLESNIYFEILKFRDFEILITKTNLSFRLTDIDLEAMETILKENQLLKQQLHSCYMKVAKTQKV